MIKTGPDIVTKKYLDQRLRKFKAELGEELKEDLGGEIKGELWKIKDEIVGEIKAIREEFDTHQSSHMRINDDLQVHTMQIKNLQVTMKLA